MHINHIHLSNIIILLRQWCFSDRAKSYFVWKSFEVTNLCAGEQRQAAGPGKASRRSGDKLLWSARRWETDCSALRLYWQHSSIKYMNPALPRLLSGFIMFYQRDDHCNEGKSGNIPSYMSLESVVIGKFLDFPFLIQQVCEACRRLQWIFSMACQQTSSSKNL